MPTPAAEATLQTLNRRLGELLHLEPLELTTGAGAALADHLWVWGILGGKEVGKSTLIDALAGAPVTAGGERPGEGTARPTAFLCPHDRAALEARFGDLNESVIYRAEAPDVMRGLALVDLPDYDSLFDAHVDVVREVARLLDGIIWVTTPKKVADIRGITEVQDVLKDRGNFVYVVNKIDWLLAQSNGTPGAALEHMRALLDRQVAACDPGAADRRTFLISARHRAPVDTLAAIAHSRDLADTAQLRATSPDMDQAVDAVARDFERLAAVLTAPPSTAETQASKQANLDFQTRAQQQRLMTYFRPQERLNQLHQAGAVEELAAVVDRALPPSYTGGLLKRLHHPTRLFSSWSTTLFRERIAHWAVLGIIAWPLALLGSVIEGIRAALPRPRDSADDPFQADGLPLEERMAAVVDGVRRRLAGSPFADLELPDAGGLARLFRVQVTELAEYQRETALAPYGNRRPGLVGRTLRRVVPWAILVWFPLGQPLAAAGLALVDDGLGLNVHTLRAAIEALSATRVLAGLGVALLILCGMVGAVYSRAARDSVRARARLLAAEADDLAPLTLLVVDAVRRPLDAVETRLQHHVDQLNALS